MVKLIDLLREIGEASAKPYDWRQTTNEDDYKDYQFQTDSGLMYRVEIELTEGDYELDSATVNFGLIDDPDDQFVSYGDVPTRGELYRVMATITECLKDFITKNPKVKTLQFWVDKEGPELSKRANLYARYVSQQLPKWKMKRLSASDAEQERIVVTKEK